MKYYVLIFAFVICLSSLCLAGEAMEKVTQEVAQEAGQEAVQEVEEEPTKENTVYLKDGKITIESDAGIKTIDYSQKPGTQVHKLNKWEVKTVRHDPVDEALKVYKNKSGSVYQKEIVLINKEDETQTIIVEYNVEGGNDKILFSPDENFMFYAGLLPGGTNIIYGMNLSTNEEFTLDSGVDFDIFTCPNNNSSYIIVHQSDTEETIYQVYNFNREKLNVLTDSLTLDNMESYICY